MIGPEFSDRTLTRKEIAHDVTLHDLTTTLIAGNIPLAEYGKGSAKSVEHLLSELREREAKIIVGNNGELTRELEVLWVDVLCQHANGDVYILREDRQVFDEGLATERVKRRTLDSSIGEKLKEGERPEEAVVRALSEELGVSGYDALHYIGSTFRTFVPDTFPGLRTSYHMHQFAAIIPEMFFNPNGYIEKQPDKNNYYLWDLVYEAPRQQP